MKSDFIVAVTQLAAERNLPKEVVVSAIEAAMVAAFKKDSNASGQQISVTLNPDSGIVKVDVLKTVVTEITNDQREISLKESQKIESDVQLGDVVITETTEHAAGRIAAQTAKQVVAQKLKDAERVLVLEEYQDKEGDVFPALVQRIDPGVVLLEMGRAEVIMPADEQSFGERYRVSQRLKVVIQSVRDSSRGPEIIVSRSSSILVKRLFELEVPEIYNGSIEIVDISREAGSRTKVSVRPIQAGVDAVGSCVGFRGSRIQNVVNELNGEKIDIIEWKPDIKAYIAKALSPSDVIYVDLVEKEHLAIAVVPDRQLSLAIGKDGQNARLAAKLTGWTIDIKGDKDYERIPITEQDEDIQDVEDADMSVVAQSQETSDESPVEQVVEKGTEQPEELVVPDEVQDVQESDVDSAVFEEELDSIKEKEEEKEEEESESLIDVPDSVWDLPRRGVRGGRSVREASNDGGLRFAEDIDDFSRGEKKDKNSKSGRNKSGGNKSGGNKSGGNKSKNYKGKKKK